MDETSKEKRRPRVVQAKNKNMSDQLYSSLFPLLLQNYVKGDSSCDHIEEAANYIKDLEKNVKELQEKREKLKNSLSEMPNDVGSSSPSITSNTNPSINENYVKIKTSMDELEIEINTAVEEEDVFPLSKVLKMLQLDEGLNVVHCAYSKVNRRWMYVIRCQVDDGKLVDSSRLQWRLTNEISSYAA